MTAHRTPRTPDTDALASAASALHDGDLVGFPTETVYGLGADARDPAAVARVFAAKGRPSDHPLICHVASADDARPLVATMSQKAEALATAFWPGPLTLVMSPRHRPTASAGPRPHAPMTWWMNWATSWPWCWTAGPATSASSPAWWT